MLNSDVSSNVVTEPLFERYLMCATKKRWQQTIFENLISGFHSVSTLKKPQPYCVLWQLKPLRLTRMHVKLSGRIHNKRPRNSVTVKKEMCQFHPPCYIMGSTSSARSKFGTGQWCFGSQGESRCTGWFIWWHNYLFRSRRGCRLISAVCLHRTQLLSGTSMRSSDILSVISVPVTDSATRSDAQLGVQRDDDDVCATSLTELQARLKAPIDFKNASKPNEMHWRWMTIQKEIMNIDGGGKKMLRRYWARATERTKNAFKTEKVAAFNCNPWMARTVTAQVEMTLPTRWECEISFERSTWNAGPAGINVHQTVGLVNMKCRCNGCSAEIKFDLQLHSCESQRHFSIINHIRII